MAGQLARRARKAGWQGSQNWLVGYISNSPRIVGAVRSTEYGAMGNTRKTGNKARLTRPHTDTSPVDRFDVRVVGDSAAHPIPSLVSPIFAIGAEAAPERPATPLR